RRRPRAAWVGPAAHASGGAGQLTAPQPPLFGAPPAPPPRPPPPLCLEIGVPADLRQLRGAVQRDPAHQLGGDIVLGLAARLPDPLVGLLPDAGRALGLGLNDRPQPPRQPLPPMGVEQDGVEAA